MPDLCGRAGDRAGDRQTDLIVGPNPVSFAVQAKKGAMEEHIPLVQFPMTLESQDSPLGYDQC